MRFGTDGVRGLANETISVDLAVLIGRAASTALAGDELLIARDTRVSGPMLSAALAAGANSVGRDVVDLGVLPTPGLAHECARRNQPGAMVSASHNAFFDNGIKLFAAGGLKLTDSAQQAVEQVVADATSESSAWSQTLPTGDAVGTITLDSSAANSYVEHLISTQRDQALAGLKVVIDCANGAASGLAADALRGAGAQVTALFDAPDGVNINAQCGSTYPESLAAAVHDSDADVGFAFDGDADRMLAVDNSGELVDGDQLIAIAAIDMHRRNTLANDTVVVTVMTNLGFRLGMEAAGIAVLDTKVGDRYVLEALDRDGHCLGGEQSGHIIFRDHATTGDGILSALVIGSIVTKTSQSLAELAAASMTRLPQQLTNVAISAPMPDVTERIAAEIQTVSNRLGSHGRVLVRPSGTEPVVRVMAEASQLADAKAAVDELVAAVEAL